ncbi:MAG: GGDEF domain-containing protein [Treponema sp.]|nr:GGDEF domain-containing protein [Treponema sp.]
MNKSQNQAKDRYVESCITTLEGYSEAVYFYFENFRTSLNSIFDKNLFSSIEPSIIQEWINLNKDFMHKDIDTVFYVNSDKTGYFPNNVVRDLKNREYVNKELYKPDTPYYISNVIYSEFANAPVLIMCLPYFNESNELKGLLCAGIKLASIEKIIDKIQIKGKNFVYLLDKTGRYVIHPNKSQIGLSYVPSQIEYKDISTNYVSNKGFGILETINDDNVLVDLYFNKVADCNLTLAIAFPKTQLEEIYSQQKSTKITILVISILSLLIFVFLETSLLDYCYKNQLISSVYDSLTNLFSRQHFEKLAEKQIKKNPKSKFMLIEADIRGFKFINQNYGEEAADKMIFYFSTLLNKAVAPYRAITCRGYADHFFILIEIHNVYKAMSGFKSQTEFINNEIKRYDIPFFPKYGITFFRQEKRRPVSVKELIGQASFAKSTIKGNMLQSFAIYNSRLLDKANEEHYMEHRMENALEKGEFFVVYQPKIHLADDRIAGGEALVRWRTREFGILTPDKFIPLFERNGFITKLDFYVYEQVFKFLDAQLKAGKPVVPIAVNMSRNHNKPDKFMHDFMTLFNKYDIPPNLVQVEIIERSVMDSDTLCEITERLHEKGFTVAMDDFGSGESSLNMLTTVPVDVLKFDRFFLLSIMDEKGALDEKSARFISSLIDLSKTLEKKTIFEGVETVQQRDFLKEIRCDQVQGYFYSRPLSEKDFVDFINSNLSV